MVETAREAGSQRPGLVPQYQNPPSGAIATYEIIEEVIALEREMLETTNRGDELGLSDDEVASMTLWPKTKTPSL